MNNEMNLREEPRWAELGSQTCQSKRVGQAESQHSFSCGQGARGRVIWLAAPPGFQNWGWGEAASQGREERTIRGWPTKMLTGAQLSVNTSPVLWQQRLATSTFMLHLLCVTRVLGLAYTKISEVRSWPFRVQAIDGETYVKMNRVPWGENYSWKDLKSSVGERVRKGWILLRRTGQGELHGESKFKGGLEGGDFQVEKMDSQRSLPNLTDHQAQFHWRTL